MTSVRFAIASVRSDPRAAAPTLVFRVVAEEPSGASIQAAVLRCQVYIDVRHFGDSTWIRLDRRGFDALDRVRRLRGFVTWNQVVEAVCAECIAEDPLAWRLGPEPL